MVRILAMAMMTVAVLVTVTGVARALDEVFVVTAVLLLVVAAGLFNSRIGRLIGLGYPLGGTFGSRRTTPVAQAVRSHGDLAS